MVFSALEVAVVSAFMSVANVNDVPLQDALCLAQNVYHEARGESLAGQRAVAWVTLNRVESGRWPDAVCDVVYQRAQFSWTLRGPERPRESDAYEQAVAVALNALTGVSNDPTGGATYFFAHEAVSPSWARSFHTVAVIGGHTFQRQ